MPEPEHRPPPLRLNAAPRTKGRSPGKTKIPKSPRRPRGRRPGGPDDDSTLPYWIAGVLVVILVALMALYAEAAQVRAWFAGMGTPAPAEQPAPAPIREPVVQAVPSVSEQEKADAARLHKMKEDAERKAKLLAEKAAQKTAPVVTPPPQVTLPPPPKIVAAPPPPPEQAAPIAPQTPVPTPPPATATEPLPPLVQPRMSTPGVPARALPLDPNVLTTERIAAYQVALERMHFSCGFIDGDQGMRTQRMLRAFQTSRGLPVTGVLDPATRATIGEPGEPFLSYVVTADDVASIMPKPPTWRAKSEAKRLGYNEIWELLAEKFHCTRGYLKALNPGVVEPVAGTEIIGPKVFPAAPIPKAASLRIVLAETSIEALDANGRIIAFFPCSIAKDKNKRPHGLLTVKVVDPNPDYTFDPALFADAAKEENITHKIVLPPGPRNPVGTTWVGLSLPGYGIHGTPEPENISRTQSHGCFRLANWNAEKVLKMVRVGTPVDVEP